MKDRTRGERLPRRDLALAAVLGGLSLLQVLVEPIAAPLASVVVALGSTLPLAFRQRFPAAAALAGSVVWLIPTSGFLFLGFVVAALLYYSVGSQLSSLRVVVAVASLGAGLAVVATLLGPEPPPAAFGSALAVLGPAAAGRLVAHQRAQNARLRALTAQLVEERAYAERTAVAEERSRIARELHDVIGHDVTVIALQADAAAAALARAPELASAPVAAIREAAADALTEMRAVLGLLRVEGDAALRPQPGLRDLPALVDRCRDTGVDVALALDPPAQALPASVQLAVYRVVQETLTNARRHAAGAAVDVQVRSLEGYLEVQVVDTGGRSESVVGAGTGLIGMRERIQLLGGELRTGSDPRGGFRVTARLPLEPVSAS